MTRLDDVPQDLRDELVAAGLDLDHLWAKLAEAVREDLPDLRLDDPTSGSTIPADDRGEAVFATRQDGVVAGLGIAAVTFTMLGADATVTDRVADGTRVAAGDVVMRVTGLTQRMLVAERTALNVASHLSGIATATARWVDALEGSPTRVLDTRKTLPGLRAWQKYAVRCGGGVNHRTSLQDMAMVKDNHVVAAGGVLPALEAIRGRHPALPVEVEVTDLDQLEELLALPEPPERVLLDNMDDATMAEAVRRTAGRVPLEASGGITLERAARIGATGVDFVSVGALTHSVTVLDLGMDLRS
ncbi:carboxylating nicotinate-nucleotide diphosphorylase [Nocardioides zeicaulis]|uniref:nicotinate-nucleotide diphosphorylase (carboxylating) n=1 Tax=Nocardioides zeicaulis TaxID=1776857 RepID=A0ABV6E3F4_9ACTN